MRIYRCTWLASLAAVLFLVCGVATAEPVPLDVGYASAAQCLADQHCDVVVASQVAGPVIQLPSLDAYRSTLLRSDMRVASAGLVFNRTVDEVLSEGTAPS